MSGASRSWPRTPRRYGATGGVKINIVDTPGHADFGGEVERALTMVDGVLLLVDASEGPLPQTRFVLRKTLEADLPVVVVINKVDRPDARIDEVDRRGRHLFLDLATKDHQLDFPILYASARQRLGRPHAGAARGRRRPHARCSTPSSRRSRRPVYDPEHPFQALVTNLDASPYVGPPGPVPGAARPRASATRSSPGAGPTARSSRPRSACCTSPRTTCGSRPTRPAPARSSPSPACADVTLGETLADLDDPRPLPVITVDEPSLSMTIGINTSPLNGRDGTKLTARLVKSRLDAELVGNVSLRVLPTDRPDRWEVQGRGELQLAVLVETMRREGFELTVGKPQVLTRNEDGRLQEPVERVSVDVPEDHVGTVTQLLGARRGRMEQLAHQGSGWVRMEWVVPARGLIGVPHRVPDRDPGHRRAPPRRSTAGSAWAGEIRSRPAGSIVADRRGRRHLLRHRADPGAGDAVRRPGRPTSTAGMIVGENSRPEDMDVNICREKKVTNIRSSTAEATVTLTPPRLMTLDQALEFIGTDECVEVTPIGGAAAQGGARRQPPGPGPQGRPQPRHADPAR